MHPIVAWGTVISHPLGHCAKAGTLQPEIKKHQQILAISIHVGGSKPMDSQKSRSTQMYVHE